MRIYTRTGDRGQTSLFSGERVAKHDLRVETYGTVDELNAWLGLAAAQCGNARLLEILEQLQNELFVAGSDLATRSTGKHPVTRIGQAHWRALEALIDECEASLPPLRTFILPGGSPGASILHLARTVCRRAERALVHLMQEDADINPELLTYINRLSDLLFVMARLENHSSDHPETEWRSGR